MDARPIPTSHRNSISGSSGLGERGNLALISVHGDPAVSKGREALGALNVYVRQLGEALAHQGWRVDMFTRRSDPAQAQIVEHGPNCRTIRLDAGPMAFVDRHHLYDCLPAFLDSFLEFQVRSRVQYALVHTNYWLSSWVGIELRKHQLFKHVHTYHSLGTHAVAHSDPELIAARGGSQRLDIERQSLAESDLVVATSPQERDALRNLISHEGRIEIVPCGADLQTFSPMARETARQQLKFTPDQKLVLYAGRFDPRKGVDVLIRALADAAMAEHSDCQLLIAGGSRPGQADGQERDRLETLIHDLKLEQRVRFLGHVDQDLLSTYYAAADLCCLPSHEEPFGLAALEAMACGTPVVASAVGGLNFIVLPEQTGLLTPPGDAEALASAMARLLGDRAWAAHLGQASRAHVEAHFSWDGVAGRLDQVYRELLKDLHSEFFVAMNDSSELMHR